MKYLSILMVGVALLAGGCGKKEVLEGKPPREVSTDELIFRENIAYVRGETEPFTGTVINYFENGKKESEVPYVNGKKHGTRIMYYEDGSKRSESPHVDGIAHGTAIWCREDGSILGITPWVNGKEHGTAIGYNRDGSKWLEIVWENGKKISRKEF